MLQSSYGDVDGYLSCSASCPMSLSSISRFGDIRSVSSKLESRWLSSSWGSDLKISDAGRGGLGAEGLLRSAGASCSSLMAKSG